MHFCRQKQFLLDWNVAVLQHIYFLLAKIVGADLTISECGSSVPVMTGCVNMSVIANYFVFPDTHVAHLTLTCACLLKTLGCLMLLMFESYAWSRYYLPVIILVCDTH